jgi:PIN domain nuclease of toxin-antitoxin system
MSYLLDTHTWIWWNARPKALSSKARSLIAQRDSSHRLLLSAISVWELAKLVEKGRLTLSVSGEQWMRQALDMPGLELVPLSPQISWHSTELPRPFHDDPADQIIVATARLTNATIITKDRLLRRYRHVSSTW